MVLIITEIVFNVALILLFIYCYWYIGETTPPPDPGNMGSGVWPQLLLGVLIVLISVNLIRSIRKYRQEERNVKLSLSLRALVTNKLFLGSAILILYSIIIDYLGYLLSTILFVFFYMTLLSEKRWWFRIITSLAATIVFYIVFARLLLVPLPRGIGILRDFALLLETL